MAKKDDALDIVAQLLGNESKKDTPSRKNTPKATVSSNVTYVDVDDDEDEDEKPRARKAQKLLPTFVTPEEYEKLGKPQFGYTTARINKFNGIHSEEYYDVLLEYYRAAIKYTRLTKMIGWYEIVDEHRLALCRKELEAFRTDNKLTIGDISEILQIVYWFEHNRKKLTSRLIEVARLAFEIKKTKDSKLTVAKLANVPANIRPVLKYVQHVAATIEDEPEVETVEQSVADILSEVINDAPKKKVIAVKGGCEEHPTYRGLRINRNGCKVCSKLYERNKKSGLKEERNYE